MKIPFGTLTITRRTKELVNEALDSGRLSNGRFVREFEKRFAELIGTREAVAMSSGTDADALALAALQLLSKVWAGSGDHQQCRPLPRTGRYSSSSALNSASITSPPAPL